jgi:adenosine/AMP kinase
VQPLHRNPCPLLLLLLLLLAQGILGVIDGMISTAYETEEDKQARHSFLRMIGYKR